LNILFICGSLEPGRDGVGDYTRRLAGEVIRQGHQASIIALNDPYITPVANTDEASEGKNRNHLNSHVGEVVTVSQFQFSDGTVVSVLRLSRSIPWFKRMRMAKQFINTHNPDWLSLQFVPYSFHPKGLPLRLPGQLKLLGGGRKWHVMFHELWIGITRSSPIKHKLTGIFQREVTRNLIMRLNPNFINTSIPLYVEMLRRINVRSERLPIFSNIPKSNEDFEWLQLKLSKHNVDLNTSRHQLLVVGIFGSLYFSFDIDSAIRQLKQEAIAKNKKLVVLVAGSQAGIDGWSQKLSAATSGTSVINLGKLTTSQVSAFLSSIDIGIPASPWQMLGKSGVAAATFEHGVNLRVFGDTPLPEFESVLTQNRSVEGLFWPLSIVASVLVDRLQGKSG